MAGYSYAGEKPMIAEAFHPELDPGIANEVKILRAAGIETFESCQGGQGHAYPEPTVRFYGDSSEGFRALAAALKSNLRVASLRRTWPVIEGEPTGPWWELTFYPTKNSGSEGTNQLRWTGKSICGHWR